MADTPQVIRQQMSETRTQLADKLGSLEQQVTDTVQSTGSAVNATAGAVKETMQSVTGAVQDAVKSVSNAFDLGRQMERHPWLVLGGALALGYLAMDIAQDSAAGKSRQRTREPQPDSPGTPQAALGNNQSVGGRHQQSVDANGGHLQTHENTAWHHLTTAVTGAIIGIVNDAATQVVPQIMGYFNRRVPKSRPAGTEAATPAVQPRGLETPD